jgi:hypothetical protein
MELFIKYLPIISKQKVKPLNEYIVFYTKHLPMIYRICINYILSTEATNPSIQKPIYLYG